LPFELIKVDQGMGLIEPIYDFLNISIPENINLMPPNNTRDYRIYTILSRLPWLNILSRPHPANGYIGINQTGIRDLLIKTAEIVVTQQVKNRIIGSDKKLIETYLKPFIILSNKKTQELTGLDLAQYNYTLS
jgi:hypothetical protein